MNSRIYKYVPKEAVSEPPEAQIQLQLSSNDSFESEGNVSNSMLANYEAVRIPLNQDEENFERVSFIKEETGTIPRQLLQLSNNPHSNDEFIQEEIENEASNYQSLAQTGATPGRSPPKSSCRTAAGGPHATSIPVFSYVARRGEYGAEEVPTSESDQPYSCASRNSRQAIHNESFVIRHPDMSFDESTPSALGSSPHDHSQSMRRRRVQRRKKTGQSIGASGNVCTDDNNNLEEEKKSGCLPSIQRPNKFEVKQNQSLERRPAKFSVKARQIMEERLGKKGRNVGTGLELADMMKSKSDLVEIRLFKKSLYYKALEQTSILGLDFQFKVDGSQSNDRAKFDLDSDSGQLLCKSYLQSLERLFSILKLKQSARGYRDRFSKAYKVLYQGQNGADLTSGLCFLVEILDSAQEGFPYLWVNGEKYVFSQDVLDSGQAMFGHFCKVKNFVQSLANRLQADEIAEVEVLNREKQKLELMLELLDKKWTQYEQCYVFELMVIETDARRFIVEAINLDIKLKQFEQSKSKKGLVFIQSSDEYNCLREQLVKKVCEINAVANVAGKGRDDFELELLLKAEEVGRRFTVSQSSALRRLSDQIKTSLQNFRLLIRKYSENIEVVDPQLKNNSELVETLGEFERAWALGKEHLMDASRCHHLLHFSSLIENTAEKHKQFRDQVECRESDIFIQIPCLLILKSLEDEETGRGICSRFLPLIFTRGSQPHRKFQQLLEEYSRLKSKYCVSGGSGQTPQKLIRSKSIGQKSARISNQFDFSNELEVKVLGLQSPTSSECIIPQKEFQQLEQLIKQLGMELSRHNPSEWNEFMVACLGGLA